MFMPGAIVADAGAGDGLGAVVIPGIGAIVAAGDGFADGAAGAGVGVGVFFFAGAGVAIGIPGMGAIVGCAATAGEVVRVMRNAATAKRVASKGTSGGDGQAYYLT